MLPHLQLPAHHEVLPEDVVERRLHGTLAAAAEADPASFEELLLTPGIGRRTVASLAMISEVVHGAPSRFTDPARFSLALGGKDGHPFPVPLAVYDAALRVYRGAIDAARLGADEKLEALRHLDREARRLEAVARGPGVEAYIAEERAASSRYGGMTVNGPALPVEAPTAPPRASARTKRRGAMGEASGSGGARQLSLPGLAAG